MARFLENARVQPWPERHVCDDGVVRSLSVYIPDEWATHPAVAGPSRTGCPPGDGRGGQLVWMSHRIRAARSLGRDPVAMVARMSGRKPLPRSPLF